jgi:excisionase family DNA binding protein
MSSPALPANPGHTAKEKLAPLPPTAAVLAYRINDAAAISGLGRSSLYKLMNSGQLRAVKVAGRRLIPAEALRELMQGAA